MRATHGTPTRYSYGCRCDPCRKARSAYAKRRRLAVAKGIPSCVDASSARHYIQELRAIGLADEGAIAQAGVSAATYYAVLSGRAARIHVATESRILAIRPTEGLGCTSRTVDATGARRRLQALVAAGWPQITIAAQANVVAQRVGITIHGAPRVGQIVDQRIRDTYTRIARLDPTQHGVSDTSKRRARRYAEQRGWQDIQFWEDYEHRIDDAGFDPAEAEQPAPRYIRLAEDWAWLEQQGYTRVQAADRLGVSRDNLEASIRRASRCYGVAA